MPKAIFNWSGGKDSSLALHRVLNDPNFTIEGLLTSVNKSYNRISMHGVRRELLEAQAEALKLPLHTIELPEDATMEIYNQRTEERVKQLHDLGYRDTVFGDIFLEDLRKYREEQSAKMGFTCHFPLWKEDTRKLAEEFIDLGFKTILVCVNGKQLDRSFAGRLFDRELLNDLPENVDPCGENGEFHTYVYDGPIFPEPINIKTGEVVERSYKTQDPTHDTKFYYCDLLPG